MTSNQALIVEAYNKGYRIVNGECVTPKGKILKGTVKKHPLEYRQLSIKTKKGARSITYHGLLAYQLYGEKYFEPNMVARHLNGNGLDNSESNIILGTQKENKFDMSEQERKNAIRKGEITKQKLTPELLQEIKAEYEKGKGAKELYKQYNTCLNTMYIIIRKIKNNTL